MTRERLQAPDRPNADRGPARDNRPDDRDNKGRGKSDRDSNDRNNRDRDNNGRGNNGRDRP